MRLEKLTLRNIRHIGNEELDISFRADKNVTILLGNNGQGKTTILDAIATIVAPYLAQFPGISDFLLRDMDVHIKNNGHHAGYLAVKSLLCSGNLHFGASRFRKGSASAPKSSTETLKGLAIENREAIKAGRTVSLPVFVYYGTGRGQFQVPARKTGFAKTYERWDAYKSALTPATDFKRFFGWFDLMEDEERRERESRRDWNYKSPMLEAVRHALSKFIPNFVNPRTEIHPLRFVMDHLDADGHRHELRIEQLSDGYKIMIAMVADLAARMAEANPNAGDILNTSGIVLIDEVDLHLHPQWQRTVLQRLTDTFPNIQFIVSTHSPIIVVGGASVSQVVNLNSRETLSSISEDDNVGMILMSELFGLKSLQAPKWDADIAERENLLSKPTLTEDEQTRLLELDEKLHNLTSLSDHILFDLLVSWKR